MVRIKVGKYETEQAVLKAMREVGKPVTSAYIEQAVGINYRTASKNFEEMIKRGLVHKLETVKSNFYVLADWKPEWMRQEL